MVMNMRICLFLILMLAASGMTASAQRQQQDFGGGWKFFEGDDSLFRGTGTYDYYWRTVRVPHDWSIEGSFSEKHPTTFNQGALPAGIGWYRKHFVLSPETKNLYTAIQFDGVYRNSEVWINGHYLGKRAYGYIGFRYDLTPYLKYGADSNVLAVRVDNSLQPSSRWYTGSGIYRNVWLITANPVSINDETVFVRAENISREKATVRISSRLNFFNANTNGLQLRCQLIDASGRLVASKLLPHTATAIDQSIELIKPQLWSTDSPKLYRAVLTLEEKGKPIDRIEKTFGVRYFSFDAKKGFSLNGKPMKIYGVCNHHDLGALGAAVHPAAIERQLRILKEMGCNAIRTAHNPPAPELLDLCDRMGFLVMDEAFDMWKKRKNKFDYNIDFNEWFRKDLRDLVIRDRNHPSVFMWSIGNEIREQFDSSGIRLTKEMVDIVKSLDSTRPVTCALTENVPSKNFIYQSKALDVLGFNYKIGDYDSLPVRFGGESIIAAETVSALATRGHYDLPSDSNRLWPPDSKPFTGGNADHTVSAYDHVYAYWGATHEASWKAAKERDFIAGVFVWSGFDFLGEPVPYQWPSRSSYYGIIDLAGFPKDVYYLYQSEWTKKPVLHLFPHWNWKKGEMVDLWAYYSGADEVELYLNGKTLGRRRKAADSMHVMWRVAFQPGTLKIVSRLAGKKVLERSISTASKATRLQVAADRKTINRGGDLSFLSITVTDAAGRPVPDAANLIRFKLDGPGVIEGVDNGDPVSAESFKAPYRRAYNGKCLLIVRSTGETGTINVKMEGEGLQSLDYEVKVQ